MPCSSGLNLLKETNDLNIQDSL